MEGKTYKTVKSLGTFDNFAPLELMDTLRRNETREVTQNIVLFSVPYKGKYRIRVLCFFSAYNKMKNVYSNWYYFESEKAVYPSAG